MPSHVSLFRVLTVVAVLGLCAVSASAQSLPSESELGATIKSAVEKVKPALVRIHVVDTYYREGREFKSESSGSGVVIREDGHIITNHHVAGHAKHLKCAFANKEEIEAELVGTDPLTDIAVIKLKGVGGRSFPVVAFGDSDRMRMGDHVLAMGSPLALSQSVTLGIISNNEMTMPEWMGPFGGPSQDGEDVGALVRWIGHDAEIFGGNSGGPLVNLQGEVIGINEIKMGLGGAIPGNLAREVAESLMAGGRVRRAWLGLELQPRLKSGGRDSGGLVGGVIAGAPAAAAGFLPGDHLLSLAGNPVDLKFTVQLPDFNRMVAALPIGEPVEAVVERAGQTLNLTVTPAEREAYEPKQYEQTQWGITVRDLSFMKAREMKRDNADGVLVTSVRPGGPAGDAKPPIADNDVLVSVAGRPVNSVRELVAVTEELTGGQKTPVPVLAAFERKTERLVTVVRVGVRDLTDPGLEARKAWLPAETQVITKEIAEALGAPGMTGFRVTYVYRDSTAEKAGLKAGDLILAVDDQPLTATSPEDNKELETLIRQNSIGASVELGLNRDGQPLKLSVELARSPKAAREMKRHRDDIFEFTVRDITLYDIAAERWQESQQGVLVEQVRPGGWAALGKLLPGDLLLEINGAPVAEVDAARKTLGDLGEQQPAAVVFKIMRGVRTLYIELEPRWDGQAGTGN
ncbi:MAG: PDZ domain-containing protein [Candidatus Hydrogenedens sp.]|nr:PDZ domain-containing protein [Candidatus Hydrogenedentota bacterium]NLF56681.1 PDZ domain-containing protein [Candidatus Hydrogenedens sp.]